MNTRSMFTLAEASVYDTKFFLPFLRVWGTFQGTFTWVFSFRYTRWSFFTPFTHTVFIWNEINSGKNSLSTCSLAKNTARWRAERGVAKGNEVASPPTFIASCTRLMSRFTRKKKCLQYWKARKGYPFTLTQALNERPLYPYTEFCTVIRILMQHR